MATGRDNTNAARALRNLPKGYKHPDRLRERKRHAKKLATEQPGISADAIRKAVKAKYGVGLSHPLIREQMRLARRAKPRPKTPELIKSNGSIEFRMAMIALVIEGVEDGHIPSIKGQALVAELVS